LIAAESGTELAAGDDDPTRVAGAVAVDPTEALTAAVGDAPIS
jgi:hypothetical protein